MAFPRIPQFQLRPSKRTLFGLALIFPLFLLLDYGFLLGYAKNRAAQDLNVQLQTIKEEISFENDSWQLNKLYADTLVGPYAVITSDGLMVDHGNLPSGLFDEVYTIDLQKYGQPTTIESVKGVKWRLLATPIVKKDELVGVVAAGRLLSAADPNKDEAYYDNDLKKGTTDIFNEIVVNDAGQISTENLKLRDVDPLVSAFGVVAKNGRLLPVALGAFPFKATTRTMEDIKRHLGGADLIKADSGERYLAVSQVVKDSAGNEKGVVVVASSFKEISRILQAQVNVVGVLLGAFGFILIILSAPRVLVRRGAISVEQAIKTGENARIEFKEILPTGNSLAKHVAGMANNEGGFLFIGICDDGRVVGAEATLQNYQKQKNGHDGDKTQKGIQSLDHLERHILNEIRSLVTPAPEVKIERVEFEKKTVLRITITRSRNMVHMVSGVLYLRHGNQTLPAKSEEILRLVRARV